MAGTTPAPIRTTIGRRGADRRRRPRRLAILAAAVLTASVVASAPGAPSNAATPAVGGPPAQTMVPPSSFGPYRVGRQVLQIRSRTGRSRTVDVLYPVDPQTTGRPSVYTGPTFGAMSFTARALDRVPVSPGRPFPLVVYSHGSGGLRFVVPSFTETLASHGFVVVSADHTGDTTLDSLGGHPPTSSQTGAVIASRAADVRMIVNGILTRSATRGDLLHGAVDPKRIGMTGHSWGGLTAFATVAGHDRAPAGEVIPRDARFKAIVTMDATSDLLTPSDLAKVTVPTMSIVGEDVPPGYASFWYQTRATPLLELRIDRAHHLSFTDICFFQRVLRRYPHPSAAIAGLINGLADSSCRPPHLSTDVVHLLTNRYAVAFLLTHLAGDRRYASYLNPRSDAESTLTAPSLVPLTPGTTTSPLVLD